MELKFCYRSSFADSLRCSNRTFMELKFQGRLSFRHVQRSNRTFMELKYRKDNNQTKNKPVLIVPLWN